MSFTSSSKKEQARKDSLVAQFRDITGASQNDAAKHLKKHGYKLESALNELYNDPTALAALTAGASSASTGAPSTTKIGKIFDEYKDQDGEDITIEGTMAFCEAIELGLEDAGVLALSYELKSPQMGVFTRQGWIEGWKALRCDSIASMKTGVAKLQERLVSDPTFFRKVYLYTFDFAKAAGQRSIPAENAQAFWEILLPIVTKSAQAQANPDFSAWNDACTQQFLKAKAVKGISKDAWTMFLDFVRTIDSELKTYDENAAWPSLIDDFVESRRA